MRLLDDKDISAVQASISQVIKDAIGETARVVIPAIEQAAQRTLGAVKITVGPIHIDPIEITVGVKE